MDQTSTNCLRRTWEGFQFITPFRHPSRRYSRSKSNVVENRAKFGTVFALPNFRGAGPPKRCTQMIMPIARPAARHVEKFREVTAPSNKVIRAHTLNFKPNFEFWLSPKKIWGGTPIFEHNL